MITIGLSKDISFDTLFVLPIMIGTIFVPYYHSMTFSSK